MEHFTINPDLIQTKNPVNFNIILIEFYIFLYGDWPGFLSRDVGICGTGPGSWHRPGIIANPLKKVNLILIERGHSGQKIVLIFFFILGRSENFRNIGLLGIEIWYSQKSRVETSDPVMRFPKPKIKKKTDFSGKISWESHETKFWNFRLKFLEIVIYLDFDLI